MCTTKNFKATNVTKAQLAKAVRESNSEKVRVIITDVNTNQIDNIVEFYSQAMLIRDGREISAKICSHLGNFTQPHLETAVECVPAKVNHYDHPIEASSDETATEFEDSSEATTAIEDIHNTINDPRFQHWFDSVDEQYPTKFGPRYAQIRQQLTSMIDEIMELV